MANNWKRRKRIDAKGRSIGEEVHVKLYRYMLKSDAWYSLSPKARAMYVEIKRFYNGSNNGEFFFSVRMGADRVGITPNTSAGALVELQSKGFIRALTKGSFNRKVRHATKWLLTEYAHPDGLPTHDYQRWSPNNKIQKSVSKSEQSVSRADTEF